MIWEHRNYLLHKSATGMKISRKCQKINLKKLWSVSWVKPSAKSNVSEKIKLHLI